MTPEEFLEFWKAISLLNKYKNITFFNNLKYMVYIIESRRGSIFIAESYEGYIISFLNQAEMISDYYDYKLSKKGKELREFLYNISDKEIYELLGFSYDI